MAKRCAYKSCRKLFKPYNSMTVVCSPACAIEYSKTGDAQKHREKAQRQDTRQRKEKIKSRADHIKDAQKAFNAYIRARDANDGCISCDRLNAAKYDCGHYRSTGAAGHLRFNEDNAHKQCARPCNQDLSGNPIEYRIRLIKKIGVERVEALENNNDVVKWSIDDIKEIKTKYKAKLKELL